MSLEIYQMTERTQAGLQAGRLERTRQRRDALGTDEPSEKLGTEPILSPVRFRLTFLTRPLGRIWQLVTHPAHA